MIELALGVAAIGVTVEWVAPWIVEQQIRFEQYLEHREQQQVQRDLDDLELSIEDHLLNNGYRELPKVIVIPLGEPEEPPRQRLIIPGDRDDR